MRTGFWPISPAVAVSPTRRSPPREPISVYLVRSPVAASPIEIPGDDGPDLLAANLSSLTLSAYPTVLAQTEISEEPADDSGEAGLEYLGTYETGKKHGGLPCTSVRSL